MKRSMISVIFCVLMFVTVTTVQSKEYHVNSPDKTVRAEIRIVEDIRLSIYMKNDPGENLIFGPSSISMNIDRVGELGEGVKVVQTDRMEKDEWLYPVVRQKNEKVRDHFSELTIQFEKPFQLIVRAYNDGIAYRFVTDINQQIRVKDETAIYTFPDNSITYFPEEVSFFSHNERYYEVIPFDSITTDRFCSLPCLVDTKLGAKILITETDLKDYPGMWLTGTGESAFRGIFPHVALKDTMTRDRSVPVTQYADYLADTDGQRTFPWRMFIVAKEDGDLIASEMVYKLSAPCALSETDWIKPGLVAWDWWNACNVHGVDFKSGVNTETYKYYIDFAAAHNIPYIILDEGWYKLGDLMSIVPDMDMEELFRYAKEKDVGIILWVVWKTLEDQMQVAMDQFERWGAAGIKVDFMQRDDQWMVDYYWRVAAEAAKRHMLVDYHGSYKPAGLHRTYPNVITREGVCGLEQVKWSERQTPEHDLMLPFIRMVAGPMDYTPGAMVNAAKGNFADIFNRPMSKGTRCHQMAMYVIYESPLQMLCDSPSNYLREEECIGFLSTIPTVWDETMVLSAKVGDYVLMVRRSGEEWYVGAMTDWERRDFDLDLSFIGNGEYQIEIFKDGINADRYGDDYKRVLRKVNREENVPIHLAPGGGWVAKIKPVK